MTTKTIDFLRWKFWQGREHETQQSWFDRGLSSSDVVFSTPEGLVDGDGDPRGYVEPRTEPGNTGTVNLDLSAYNVFEVTPTGDITFTFSGKPATGVTQGFTVIVYNSTYALTWPAGTEHPGGAAPVLDGKTYLSGVVEGDGTVVVGQAWAGVA